MCGRDHCRTCNEIPKGRAVTDRDSLTVTHSLARIFSVPTIISTCIFVLPFFTLPPTASSILRPGPFTLVTYPSPLTDTDRYQMNVFPGRRQWISGVMRHSAGTPSRHCLRVLVRLRVWSKKVFGTSLTGHSHAHPPFFLVLYMYHQVCWFILCTYLYIFPPSYTLKLQKGLPAPHC